MYFDRNNKALVKLGSWSVRYYTAYYKKYNS